LLEQTIGEMPEDYPLRGYVEGMLAAATLTGTAARPTPGGVDRVVALATRILEERDGADQAEAGKAHFLVGMALILRGQRDGRSDDLRVAAERLRTAMELVPPHDPTAP